MRAYLKAAFAMLIITWVGMAAKKPRDWKTGKVLDSTTAQLRIALGSTTDTVGRGVATTTVSAGTATTTASESSNSTTTIQHMTIRETELLVVGEEYVYIIQDAQRKGGPIIATALRNRHHGCRFVVGEDIKYAQEKGDLYVLDADSKECRLPILRQQRREAR